MTRSLTQLKQGSIVAAGAVVPPKTVVPSGQVGNEGGGTLQRSIELRDTAFLTRPWFGFKDSKLYFCSLPKPLACKTFGLL